MNVCNSSLAARSVLCALSISSKMGKEGLCCCGRRRREIYVLEHAHYLHKYEVIYVQLQLGEKRKRVHLLHERKEMVKKFKDWLLLYATRSRVHIICTHIQYTQLGISIVEKCEIQRDIYKCNVAILYDREGKKTLSFNSKVQKSFVVIK